MAGTAMLRKSYFGDCMEMAHLVNPVNPVKKVFFELFIRRLVGFLQQLERHCIAFIQTVSIQHISGLLLYRELPLSGVKPGMFFAPFQINDEWNIDSTDSEW